MNSDPGEECGVKGGCRACPLFAANICGDPAPEETEGPPTDHVHDVACWYLGCTRFDVVGEWAEPDAPSRPQTSEPVPVCVQTHKAVVPCGTTAYCTSVEAVALARTERLDPDAPDVDPNEPQPEGLGCGCCSA